MSVVIFIAASMLASASMQGVVLPNSVKRIDSCATISWVAEGELASSPEFVKTALDGSGKSRLLNGTTGGSGEAMVFGPWGGGGASRASFIVDLKATNAISKVTLWSAEDQGLRGCGDFSVSLSNDGSNFVELAKCVVPKELAKVKIDKGLSCVPIVCELERPASGRFVRIVANQQAGRRQMVLGEVAVWGPMLGTTVCSYTLEQSRPCVEFVIDGWSSGAATLDWASFAPVKDVVSWRIYVGEEPFDDVRAQGVERLAECEKSMRSFIVYPLKPGVERHYAVTAVYPKGENPRVRSRSLCPLKPLEVRRFRDMLGFNYFWGGGGANSKSKAYYDVAADFLVDIGIRRIRWWMTPEWAVRDQYNKRGIELNGWTGQKDVAAKYGIYLHDIGNEPELSPRTPAECVEIHRKAREDWKSLGDDHKFYGPVVNVGSRGFEYLKGFIEAGGAAYVDAIDVHTYCAGTSEFVYPDGYPKGSPEALFDRIRVIRDYLTSRGIDKPLTCSEWGYSDTRTANPHMEDPTPLHKAQFLVRGCIIHHALDFRRLYMYSFYDEGYDSNYSEEVFGIVSRDCQKKPAYIALRNMVRTLGDSHVSVPVRGLGKGDFGFVFRTVDGPGCQTVVWNGARERRGVFRTKAASVRVVSLFGDERTVKPKEDGTFLAKFGPLPVYLVSNEPVEAVQISDETTTDLRSKQCLDFEVKDELVVGLSDEKKQVVYSLSNPGKDALHVQLTLRNENGEILSERRDEIGPAERKDLSFSADMRGAALERFLLTVDYDFDGESFSETRGIWVRELAASKSPTVEDVRFSHLDASVIRVSSPEIELTIDASRGGQILDLVDKRTRRSQINVDYGKLPVLASIPYAYCLWDSVGSLVGRRTPFAAETLPTGVRLTAQNKGVTVVKTITVDSNRLLLNVEAMNHGSTEVNCTWHIHPEYTPGGVADSYSDYMLIPTPKGEYKLVFWSGLGERKLDAVSDGWWKMIDPKARYTIRQTYDASLFDVPKLWFGVGAWNVELYSRKTSLKPGERTAWGLAWTFELEK